VKFENYRKIILRHSNKCANRFRPMVDELKRIGIFDLPNMAYHLDEVSNHNSFFDVLDEIANDISEPDATYLILEDDIRFLKDIDKLHSIFETAPDDKYDLINFDPFIYLDAQTIIEMRRQYKTFAPMNVCIYSASCISIKKRIAPIICSVLRKNQGIPPDHKFIFRNPAYKSCFSLTNAGIQLLYRGCSNMEHGWAKAHHQNYKRAGIRYSDYAVPDGYDYGSVVQ